MEHDATPPPSAPIAGLHPADVARIAARIDRPIVLVGMMGVGKTTVGRRLATMLDLPFVDADEEIERAAHMTIPEIFAQFGEPYFRDGERRVIARLVGEGSAADRKILATGGGAFVDPQTRGLILDRAISVWLDSDVDTLIERVGRKDNRPLLKQGDPREILTRLRDERRPHYEQAAIHITSGQQPHHVTANKILKAIDAWL
ncbi:shikimate kinase [Novosphingobium sp. KCTC 2891]|uniref:shikimate kinase n=1 Tax=Novosphingobium sp. KCTC 2891 TaxID=2989730 RepID=UPI002223390D|nr:shikimate kinase [Novosphingobium sp. KCTC 2891]MCW1383476.1 shikimate kinase [Novosphingobium sp. KCTC 2891]